VRAFAEAASAWQAQHGYENSWWWPDLGETLRRIGSPEVDAVLNDVRDWFAPLPEGIGGTPFDFVAACLRRAESFTPRLLAALRAEAS